ncbi:MAG TPA: prolyl oligopeptidase family serine peptidase [Candidatus Krumholzibacteria bacterium]|nr:prolyl oligopeptidase family serine peptidase [Candidatus Krumholzibacteria bacterium]
MQAARRLIATAFLVILTGGAAQAQTEPIKYPDTRREHVVDDYFGTKVPDPYRWLENLDSAETKAWVEAQNSLSQPFLAALPDREAIRARLQELWNYERYGVPRQTRSGTLFYTRNDGLQNHAVLYVQKPGDAEPRVLIDPNSWSEDATVAMAHWTVSPDERWVLYAQQTAGSDWVEYRLRDIATGEDLPDRIRGVNFNFDAARISWRGGTTGFFYSRFPDASSIGAAREIIHQKVCYHRIGTEQKDDVLIYERPDQPQWFAWSKVTGDGRFLLLALERTEEGENELYVKDLGTSSAPRLDAPLRQLIAGFDAHYEFVGSEGSVLYLKTSLDAPRFRIVSLDFGGPDPVALREVIPQSEDVIDLALHAGGELLIGTLHDAASKLRRFSTSGKSLGEIALPGTGSVRAALGSPDDPVLYFDYSSFNQPSTVYRHDLRSGQSTPFRQARLRFEPGDYVTEQVFYRSKDGTRVPMFVTHRKGLQKDGHAPALLYGYGGFANSLTPSFSVANLVWMESGGIFAQACLRGGNEYGEEWHKAGTLEHKQNVFDDFIAAAEYLVREKLTSAQRLAIFGGSNGGLLIGAVANQRPDLFAVATQSVGVLDMLRYHKFGIGYAWAGDYGTSDSEAGFRFLRAYSPYHNVKPGARYPAMLVMTADHDDRVYPGHSFKYTAMVQSTAAAGPPVLIRVETRAGHGGGTPLGKTIEQTADRLAFTAYFTNPERQISKK